MDGSKLVIGHLYGLPEVAGVASLELRWLAIGAVESSNGCRYASAWRALLGDVGERLDGIRRVLARKFLDAVGGSRSAAPIAGFTGLK